MYKSPLAGLIHRLSFENDFHNRVLRSNCGLIYRKFIIRMSLKTRNRECQTLDDSALGADSPETVRRFGNAERCNLIFTLTNLVIIDKAPHVLIYCMELKAKKLRVVTDVASFPTTE